MSDLPDWLVWFAFMVGCFSVLASLWTERIDHMIFGFFIALWAILSFDRVLP